MKTPLSFKHLELIIFDLAGTVVDYGSCAPAGVFVKLFENSHIDISLIQARGPMGMDKKDHIRTMLEMPDVAEQWQREYGRPWNDSDLERLYREFIPLQMNQLPLHCTIIPGVIELVEQLRNAGLKIATTTGYNKQMMQVVLGELKKQDFIPDLAICGDDVPNGRPEPWMIRRCMEYFHIERGHEVVKVGDTMADIKAGIAASVWTVGVIKHGNTIGLSQDQVRQLTREDLRQRINKARTQMYNEGSDFAIEGVWNLPAVINKIDHSIKMNIKPAAKNYNNSPDHLPLV